MKLNVEDACSISYRFPLLCETLIIINYPVSFITDVSPQSHAPPA